MWLGYLHKFATANDRTTTQGLTFHFGSVMFFDHLEYSCNKRPTHSAMFGLRTVVEPSLEDYLHINLLYCKGQGMQGHLLYACYQELMSRPKGGEGAYNLHIPHGNIQT